MEDFLSWRSKDSTTNQLGDEIELAIFQFEDHTYKVYATYVMSHPPRDDTTMGEVISVD